MSYGNAVAQREEMLTEYERMLKSETDPLRLADIDAQILHVKDQIAQLKLGKPLFGKPKPLNITTTFIEPNREKPGQQIVTVINPQPVPSLTALATPPKRLGNSLRQKRKDLQASAAENSLKAQIQAAKAAKQTV